MTWADLIIILVAVSLITVMKHLETMPGYSCPQYCATDHIHFWIEHPIPTDQSVKNLSSIKSGS